MENAKKYFDKYNKLKRTAQALEEQIEDTRNEILHLESVSTALDIALGESDLSQIKEELTECGYLKNTTPKRKSFGKIETSPLHFQWISHLCRKITTRMKNSPSNSLQEMTGGFMQNGRVLTSL